MPIYEYQCDRCGARRELILRPGQEARPTCTVCRKRMRRLISPTSFVLKGAGWYVTDYPSEARKKGLEAEKPAPAPAPAPEGAAKKESPKPAAAPAAAKPAEGGKKRRAAGR